MDKLIQRINELTALARERELTCEEQAERHQLRRRYIDAFKANLISNLDNVYFVEDDGSHTKLKKKTSD